MGDPVLDKARTSVAVKALSHANGTPGTLYDAPGVANSQYCYCKVNAVGFEGVLPATATDSIVVLGAPGSMPSTFPSATFPHDSLAKWIWNAAVGKQTNRPTSNPVRLFCEFFVNVRGFKWVSLQLIVKGSVTIKLNDLDVPLPTITSGALATIDTHHVSSRLTSGRNVIEFTCTSAAAVGGLVASLKCLADEAGNPAVANQVLFRTSGDAPTWSWRCTP